MIYLLTKMEGVQKQPHTQSHDFIKNNSAATKNKHELANTMSNRSNTDPSPPETPAKEFCRFGAVVDQCGIVCSRLLLFFALAKVLVMKSSFGLFDCFQPLSSFVGQVRGNPSHGSFAAAFTGGLFAIGEGARDPDGVPRWTNLNLKI